MGGAGAHSLQTKARVPTSPWGAARHHHRAQGPIFHGEWGVGAQLPFSAQVCASEPWALEVRTDAVRAGGCLRAGLFGAAVCYRQPEILAIVLCPSCRYA